MYFILSFKNFQSFLFCPFLTSDPSPPIFHCEVDRSSSLLCILATSDKMDAEGEPGMYMYMHATDYHLQNQDVNYKFTKFCLCNNISQGSEKPCCCKYFLPQISTLVSRLKVTNVSTGLHGSENKFLQICINCCSQ